VVHLILDISRTITVRAILYRFRSCSSTPAGPGRCFQFDKRRQDFIGSHKETLSVVAMRVRNPECSPLKVQSRDPAQTPSGFTEIVGDYI